MKNNCAFTGEQGQDYTAWQKQIPCINLYESVAGGYQRLISRGRYGVGILCLMSDYASKLDSLLLRMMPVDVNPCRGESNREPRLSLGSVYDVDNETPTTRTPPFFLLSRTCRPLPQYSFH